MSDFYGDGHCYEHGSYMGDSCPDCPAPDVDLSEYRFVAEWSEDNTNIEWQKAGRRVLNSVIRLYNDWQKDHDFDTDMGKRVLANIMWGITQLKDVNGGSDWVRELEEMREYVSSVLEDDNG